MECLVTLNKFYGQFHDAVFAMYGDNADEIVYRRLNKKQKKVAKVVHDFICISLEQHEMSDWWYDYDKPKTEMP